MLRRKPFIKMTRASTDSSLTMKPLNTDEPSLILYPGISQLPLNIFIDCIVDSDYDKLIVYHNPKSGKVDRVKLIEHWRILNGEYNDALSNIEHRSHMSLQKSIVQLEIDVHILKTLLPILGRVKLPNFCNEVNEVLDTSFNFDYENIESYFIDLNKCSARMGSLELKLAVKREQLYAIIGKYNMGGEVKKATREHFTNMLIELSDHAKFRIDSTIMTEEFCLRIKRYNKACEALENKNKKYA